MVRASLSQHKRTAVMESGFDARVAGIPPLPYNTDTDKTRGLSRHNSVKRRLTFAKEEAADFHGAFSAKVRSVPATLAVPRPPVRLLGHRDTVAPTRSPPLDPTAHTPPLLHSSPSPPLHE
ncbi:hypothetical protein E2C01_013918 [Portunus trituberculatus]|uniref:Uncharacterized protein n=1 Tax=Portunus trituberculatus TaxID=210409 RepID=A0A5B7DIN0_PORTR|nr:hypothetical protein [Portunus trituberculatus]